MRDDRITKPARCAIYTRKSTEDGLEQEFNSLDAQREACGAYILSQRHEGWVGVPDIYDDGGYSGSSIERPALKMLLADVAAGKIDIIVVYKVDRLTRSLADFAKIVEVLDAKSASFVSVTQAFNTTTSMGRLTLNVLLSFAQFEREVTGERIRDKIAASKAKGMWMGGPPPLGYDVLDRKLVVDEAEAETVRWMFARYLELGSGAELTTELDMEGVRSKCRVSRSGRVYGGARFSRGAVYAILKNRIYVGEVTHKGNIYPGQHEAILDRDTFDAAQSLMAEARVERRLGAGAHDPSLLAGVLWDEHGRRMSPKHSNKGSRRYRYYVTQTYNAPPCDELERRVSAPDIEQNVLSIIERQLERARRNAIAAGQLRTIDIQHLSEVVSEASTRLRGTARDQRGIVADVVGRVELTQHYLRVTSAFEYLSPLLVSDHSDDISITCVRSGRNVKLIISPSDVGGLTSKSLPMIKLVTQAMAARAALVDRVCADFDELANAIGYSREHAADLLRIGYLAPDIITAILEGRQPANLTRTKLTRWPALPLDWQQQRVALGFA